MVENFVIFSSTHTVQHLTQLFSQKWWFLEKNLGNCVTAIKELGYDSRLKLDARQFLLRKTKDFNDGVGNEP